MATPEHASGRQQQLLLLISTLLIVALQFHPVIAQQAYNDVNGYKCTVGASTCAASAYYRTQGTNSTVTSIAALFNTTAAAIANASSLNQTNALLANETPLNILLTCGCYNGTYYSPTNYTVVAGDTMFFIANSTFEGLTTYQAIEAANPSIVPTNMQIGAKLKIPVRCACPSAAQVANGTASLLSYAVYPMEDLTTIGKKFNVSLGDMEAANTWPNATVQAFSTVLVPIKGTGTGSNGGAPAPAPSAASRGFQAHLLGVVALLAAQAFIF